MDADVLATLAPTGDPAKVLMTVAERDFGAIGSAYLRPGPLHTRFLDAGTSPVGTGGEGLARNLGSAAERELTEAALPCTSGAQQGLSATVTHVLAALRTALTDGDQEALAELGPSLAQLAAPPLQPPDTAAEGRRLAAALRAYETVAPAGPTGQPAAAAQPTAHSAASWTTPRTKTPRKTATVWPQGTRNLRSAAWSFFSGMTALMRRLRRWERLSRVE
ncbi:hypothetical protein AB5J72_01025 [Streptomyces sp. CG1]|uniref:hypothetical protein n=1 Tax=Streptomyces sp. CG1 TaxID=1287523 RepID=UPI0034E25C76